MASGLRKSLYIFTAFILIWTPYRFLTGALGWKAFSLSPLQLLIESVVKLSVSFGLVYVFLRYYGDSWKDVGLSGRGFWESLVLGSVGSLWLMSFYLAAGGRIEAELLGALHLFLVVGPAEELLSRGYYFSMIVRDFRHRGLAIGALLSSFLFALSHLPIDLFVAKQDISGIALHLISVFLSGIIFCSYYYTGWNLVGPSILHASVDFCSAYIHMKSDHFISIVGMLILAAIPPIWWTIREKFKVYFRCL